jgi:hypothetical protein
MTMTESKDSEEAINEMRTALEAEQAQYAELYSKTQKNIQELIRLDFEIRKLTHRLSSSINVTNVMTAAASVETLKELLISKGVFTRLEWMTSFCSSMERATRQIQDEFNGHLVAVGRQHANKHS